MILTLEAVKKVVGRARIAVPALAVAALAISSGPAVPKGTAGPSCDAVTRRCLHEVTAITDAAQRLRDNNPEAADRLDALAAEKIVQCQIELAQACPFPPQ